MICSTSKEESARTTGAAFMKFGLAPITWTIRIYSRFKKGIGSTFLSAVVSAATPDSMSSSSLPLADMSVQDFAGRGQDTVRKNGKYSARQSGISPGARLLFLGLRITIISQRPLR